MKDTDHGRIATGENAQDAALGSAIVTRSAACETGAHRGPRDVALRCEFHQHLIAVHGRTDGRRRNEDVAVDRRPLAGVGDDEAVAVAVHDEAARNQVLTGRGMFGQGVAVATGFDQASALDQRLQALGKLLALFAAQTHLADELLVSGGVVRLTFEVPQNGLIGEHGCFDAHNKNKARRPGSAGGVSV